MQSCLTNTLQGRELLSQSVESAKSGKHKKSEKRDDNNDDGG